MVIYSELEKRIARAGSLRKLAVEWGVSAAYLCEVRLKQKPVSDTILGHLGFEKRVTYRRLAQ